MKVYTLETNQKMPVSLNEAWNFFSHPKNLLLITPPALNLVVTNEDPADEIYAGQLITYTVKPLLGIPVNWETVITYVDRNHSFIDEQKKGPYKLWKHQHTFKEIEGGVEMKDKVNYAIPFGPLGTIGHKLIIKKKLAEIFNYRFQKVIELFGAWPEEKMVLHFN